MKRVLAAAGLVLIAVLATATPASAHAELESTSPESGAELPAGQPIATVCSGGKRSGLAASILQREGFEEVIHVAHGGVGTWKRSGRPVEEG